MKQEAQLRDYFDQVQPSEEFQQKLLALTPKEKNPSAKRGLRVTLAAAACVALGLFGWYGLELRAGSPSLTSPTDVDTVPAITQAYSQEEPSQQTEAAPESPTETASTDAAPIPTTESIEAPTEPTPAPMPTEAAQAPKPTEAAPPGPAPTEAPSPSAPILGIGTAAEANPGPISPPPSPDPEETVALPPDEETGAGQQGQSGVISEGFDREDGSLSVDDGRYAGWVQHSGSRDYVCVQQLSTGRTEKIDVTGRLETGSLVLNVTLFGTPMTIRVTRIYAAEEPDPFAEGEEPAQYDVWIDLY